MLLLQFLEHHKLVMPNGDLILWLHPLPHKSQAELLLSKLELLQTLSGELQHIKQLQHSLQLQTLTKLLVLKLFLMQLVQLVLHASVEVSEFGVQELLVLLLVLQQHTKQQVQLMLHLLVFLCLLLMNLHGILLLPMIQELAAILKLFS
jgi:hypothetical protein